MGSNYRVCCFFTRSFWMAGLHPPDDVRKLFEKYAGEGGAYMTSEQLGRFLEEEQAATTEEPPEKIVERVLKEYHHFAHFTRNSLSLEDFFYYLFSLDLNPPFQSKVHQDMKAPLSHYYIFTGHNSYLTGNQLSSKSSDIPLKKALERGVRVIELDLWPNSSKDKILVHHGRTLTTSVDLLKCLKCIKEHAFVASEYPVIITLEDHLTPRLQEQAAQMINQTFGEMLYHPDPDNPTKEFPSPEKLKKKILVSTKPPKEFLESEYRGGPTDPTKRASGCFDFILRRNMNRRGFEQEDEDEEEEEHSSGGPSECESGELSQPLESLKYKHLISIKQRKKSKLDEALKIEPGKVCRVSFSEQKLQRAISSHGKDIVRFTQKNILRIYPRGSRIDSSNYSPFDAWMHGAQMVAFNMQGYGRSLWRMHGIFRGNGGCGYVKKPHFLTHENHVFDPKAKMPVKKTLKVKVYMGDGWRKDFKKTHFDSCSPPDFYAKVGIAGVEADKRSYKTEVNFNQWIPVWNKEFTFNLSVPELALLELEVYEHDNDKNDDFGGQTCLPVSELKQGIRAIPLYCRRGNAEKFKSVKLLVRFKFEDPSNYFLRKL